MTNDALRIKVRERFNKLDSQDYENLEDWQILEAFHKAQLSWVRSQLAGKNPRQEVDESTKQQVDDLNVLLSDPISLKWTVQQQGVYSEAKLPKDYLAFKQLAAQAKSDCCPARRLRLEFCEMANVSAYLQDETHRPSFEWAETFYSLAGNKVLLFLDNAFELAEGTLVYYKSPPCPQIPGVLNLLTGKEATTNVESIFSDTVTEILLDKTVQILAGDTENVTQYQRASADVTAAS